MLLAKSRSFDAIQCPDLPLSSSPLFPLRYVSSLFTTTALLLYPRMPSSAAIIRSRREARIYRFRPNSVQRDDFPHPRPFSLSTLPRANRSRNDDRNQLLCTPACECVPEGLYANGYGTCLRLLCARVYARECVYMCASLCAWREPWSSAATAPNFELASATNFEIYSTIARPPASSPPRSPIPALSARLCRRGRKNYSPVRDICAAYVWYEGIYVLACTTNTIAHNAS